METTPEPWTEQVAIPGLISGSSGHPVCTISHSNPNRDGDTALIEHAPEMYKEIMATVRYLEVRDPEQGDVHCILCGDYVDPQVYDTIGIAHNIFCPVLRLRTVIGKITDKVKT